MLYSTLFFAFLVGGVAASPTNNCPNGVCGGICGDR
jgi:hypothetical protein